MTERETIIGLDSAGVPIVLTEREMSKHVFVSGATGSGKTSLLLTMACNAIAAGAGCMFVDGKGDEDVPAALATMARRFGREDDLLLLDFSGSRGTNTLNLFSTASSDSLTQLVLSLMDETGVDGAMWKGRAVAMFTAVMKALNCLRDAGCFDLTVAAVREHINLRRIIDLGDEDLYPGMSPAARKSIQAYLTSLPGYQPEKRYRQTQNTLDQHGYLEMQFTHVLGFLADVYEHIFSATAEVDLRDLIENGRILVVSLPMGAKSEAHASLLGMLVIGMLRDMMGKLASSSRSGREGQPLFTVLLDEFGRYTLPGVDTLVAQARSLSMSFVFATQSLDATANDREGSVLRHVLANTATKVIMRTDVVDKGTLASIFPTDSNDDERIEDLRGRMARIAALASLRAMSRKGNVDSDADVERYEATLREHDALVEARSSGSLTRLLPCLPSGGMLVQRRGNVVKGTGVDMTGIPFAPVRPVVGMPMDPASVRSLSSRDYAPDDFPSIPSVLVDLFPKPGDRVDAVDAARRAVAACFIAGENASHNRLENAP